MGSLIQYKCPNCKYKVELHQGSGAIGFAKNYACKSCNKITSVIILQDDTIVIKEGINRERKYTLINDDPKQFKCEHCQSNNLEEWIEFGCPRCNHKMNEQDNYWWGFWR
jgi:Zn finger protein HypA/HybF involved in hydrogenase expression